MPQTAANIWADGPVSMPTQPSKPDIRAWGTWVESFINGAGATVSRVYNTLATMIADALANTPTENAQLGWVINDPITANNGVYQWFGALHTWNRIGDLPYSFIVASDVGAGTPSAILATSSIPVSGSAFVVTNIADTNDVSPVTISFNGGPVLTVKTNSGNDIAAGGLTSGMLIAGFRQGSTFRLISDQVSSAIVAAAEAAAAASATSAAAAAAAVASVSLPVVTTADAGSLLQVGLDGLYHKAGDIAADTDFYVNQGGRVGRVSNRLFVGDAVKHTGQQITASSDWLTNFELSVGRTGGKIQLTNFAVTNGANSQDVIAEVIAAQTKYITLTGLNAIAGVDIAVNNNNTVALSAYARYGEAYRAAGAVGGAYGIEYDTINYASAVFIDPYFQDIGQTVGVQLAFGGELSPTGQFPASAAVNIRNNGTTCLHGIIFGNDAIWGTNGNDGNTGIAVSMAEGHKISYYFGHNNISWELWAENNQSGDGDYNIKSNGTGSLKVDRFIETIGNTWTAYTPVVAAGSGALTSYTAAGRYIRRGKSVYGTISITITNNGTGASLISATLPLTPGASTLGGIASGRSTVSGKMLQGLISPGVGTMNIFNYDNTYPASTGNVLNLSFCYELA
ncbi:hypothetical protein AB4Z52_07020 [Rhizobium sp. 2YAF20]|uniref:hypothetical protein n=1 Tax=Rhizobium sp. 2YAF20 TaxID=3233027 RepID=UPI003F96EA2C